MHRLPPLNALKSFDAAARHLSFTRAAVELNVTHGAVSRQVAALERELQVFLFVRGSRGLTLTEEGARFGRAVSHAFNSLQMAADQVRAAGRGLSLRLSVPPTLAMRWLMPRLSALHTAHPGLLVEILTSTKPANFAQDDYDAAIRRVDGVPKNCVADMFLDGRSVPVCSPRYCAEHRMRGAADLKRATLIHSRNDPSAWNVWLRKYKVSRAANAPTLTFDEMYFSLQAASDSLGVALAPVAVVAEEIHRGQLRALEQPRGPRRPQYAIVSPSISPKREAIQVLTDWLKSVA